MPPATSKAIQASTKTASSATPSYVFIDAAAMETITRPPIVAAAYASHALCLSFLDSLIFGINPNVSSPPGAVNNGESRYRDSCACPAHEAKRSARHILHWQFSIAALAAGS